MPAPETNLRKRALAVFLLILSTGEFCYGRKVGPPTPRFVGVFGGDYNHGEIGKQINAWTPEDNENVWELSGLYEGDIMVHPEGRGLSKNGLIDPDARWPRGIVPFYIEEEDFNAEGIEVIKGALKEYHEKTCLRFRPYEKSDVDYVTIKGSQSGCWSMVGRHGQGQVLNLNNPKCVRHGVVLHELMHALGFYHQQSAADRDDWVDIHWENIKDGKEHNFKKYDNKTVTDYGIPYDYKSIMHYSGHAFSKNGDPTITPKHDEVKLGQRKGLTEKDISKIEKMYKEECSARETESASESSEERGVLGWLFD